MFLPIVLEPFHMSMDNYYWIYLKYLFEAYKNGWAIISHRRFIDYHIVNPQKIELKEEFYAKHEYRILTEEELDKVRRYVIEEEIFQNLIEEKGSKLEAMMFLIKERYEPLERLIESIILEIEKEEKIEGILNWQVHFKSVRCVAQRHNIPIIVNEYGPLRFPVYRTTGCICKKDIHMSDEVKVRYRQFLEEQKNSKVPILSRRELLSLFLLPDQFDKIEYLHKKSDWEIGIVGTSPVSAVLYSKSFYDDLQLINDLRQVYRDRDILFRKHPGIGDPYQADYYYIKNYDKSVSSLEFVTDCKRIASVHSSVIFEAMLYGKPTFSKCDLSQYAYKCEHNYEKKYALPVEEEFLCFILFSYLVPYEIMLNEEYLRWRLTEPSESDIYMRNLKYYCSKDEVPIEIFKCSGSIRENHIKKKRLEKKRK